MDDAKMAPTDGFGCLEAIQHLQEYLDGELNADAAGKVEEHLEHCRSCYSRAEFETALNRRLRESGGGEAPDNLKQRIRKLMDDF